MSKFFGEIGFSDTIEVEPGAWEPQIVTKQYYGDVLNISKKYQSNTRINDEVAINNKLSIVCDLYAASNFNNIVYVEWNGVKYKINSIEFKSPRLIVSIGGVYKEVLNES